MSTIMCPVLECATELQPYKAEKDTETSLRNGVRSHLEIVHRHLPAHVDAILNDLGDRI